jgi:rubrerythrin
MRGEPAAPPQEADFRQAVLDDLEKASRASTDEEAFQPGQAASLSLRRFACTVCSYWWFEWDGDQRPSSCPSCSLGTGEPEEAYGALLAPVLGS